MTLHVWSSEPRIGKWFSACFLQYLNLQWTAKKKKKEKQFKKIRNLALYKVIHPVYIFFVDSIAEHKLP